MLTGFMGTAGLSLGSGTSSDMAASVLVSGSPAKARGWGAEATEATVLLRVVQGGDGKGP